MNYEQIFIYYLDKENFNFEETLIFFESMGYYLKNPQTKSITILQKHGSSEVDYENVKELFANDVFFSIRLWLDPINCINWSFNYENSCYYQIFTLLYLDDWQIEQVAKISLLYILSELKRVKGKILGFGIDMDGSTYDYDFDSFFCKQNKTLDSYYLPDLIFVPKEKINCVSLDNKQQIINVDKNLTCIAKNVILLDYLKTLLEPK